jgi:hypothetical protein
MWFKENIELQLEDIELAQAGYKTALYFDTSDVQSAVMGLHAFYSNGEFKKYRFFRKKTFVNTLTAVGWLGEFSLLPPHLSEFYGKAENNFNLRPTTNWEKDIRDFIKDLDLLDGENEIESLTDKSEEEVQKAFSQKAGVGVHWFNAIYSMTPWHRKLGVWLRTGLLNFNGKKFDYEKTVKSQTFEELKQFFDRHRKAETINNIVDAAALTYLLELVESFNRRETNEVPRFFVPRETNNLWHKVLHELDWHQKFVCDFNFSQGMPSWIFREEDYFLYKITFRHNNAVKNENFSAPDNSEDILTKEYDTLRKWSKQVDEAIESLPQESGKLYNETLTEIHINQDLENLINSLQEYSVLEKDWFRDASAKEFLKILKESKESSAIVEEQREIYENKNFKQFIINQLEGKREELVEELEDFRLATQLYDALYSSLSGLRRRIINYPVLENDEVFPFLGLLRYGFPGSIQHIIIDILNNLRSGEADNIRSGCAEAIRCYIDGRRSPVEKANDLMVAVGVLLAVDNRSLLDKLLGNIEDKLLSNIEADKLHFSLKVAYSEFLFRREPKNEENILKGLKLLSNLVKEWESEEINPADKANLSVGLAYLYYWAWRSKGAIPVWELPLRKSPPKADFFLNYYIKNAISYADHAYLNLPDELPEKKAYALNQYLFYTIEGGDPELFAGLKERKNDLQNYRDTKAWQFRFDDTLARYYFRKAFLPEQAAKKKEFILWAKDYEDRAKGKSDGDVEVEIFHDKVKQIWEEIC